MENVSKALVMAGGIFIALMIVGALVLMFNNISIYESSEEQSKKNSQLATFNHGFTKYTDERTLKGTDIISLANKIIDYNKKEGTLNYVDYDIKMTLTINLTGFIQKSGVGGTTKLFGRTVLFNIQYDDNIFTDAIKEFSALEKKYTLGSMAKLKSNYSSIASGTKTIEQATGKSMPEISVNDIAKYIEYTELKSSIFEPVGAPEYEKGQIKKLSFKFIK